jgi:parallel beta-helix repeat protein
MRSLLSRSSPAFGRAPVALATVWLAAASTATAATYYVAPPPSGDDGNAGTIGAPWATLQHAAGELAPGDTVLLRAGSYAGGHFTTSGTSALPIRIAAFAGEVAIVDADNPVTPDGINLEGTDHVIVEGLTVTGVTRAGIRAVLCEQVTIRDNITDSNGRWGIFTGFCDDLLIEGNVTSNSGIEHGIYVSNSGDRPVIRRNLIFDNNANGIHMNGDESQGGDGVISDAIVEENVIFGNGAAGGSGINCDGVQDSIIRNNLIYDTHASGISLYQIDGGEPSTGNQVLNNTVHVASDGRWGLNVRDASTGNTVRNNAFYSEHGFRGAMTVDADSLAGFTSDYNAVEDRFTTDDGDTVLTLAQWQAMTGQDAHSFVASPAELYVAPGSDYHHAPGSPAIDAGVVLAAVPNDLEGVPRPQGATHDIGAYEAGGIFADGFESGDTSRWSATVP